MGGRKPGPCGQRARSVLILFAGCSCYYLSLGLSFAAGYYTPELLDYFGKSKSATSWVISINIAVLFGAGPIASVLMSWFTHRKVCLLGCLLSATGLFISAFVTELYHLYITYGLIAGLGSSLTYNAASVFVGVTFTKMRSSASGLLSAGGGLGILTLPPFIEWLIDIFSWKGSFIILSAASVQLCAIAMLLTPDIMLENSEAENHVTIDIDLEVEHLANDSEKLSEHKEEEMENQPLASPLIEMLSDVNFLVYALSSFLWNMGTTCVFVFSASLFERRLGTYQNSSILFTLIGIGNTVGRMLGGVSGNLKNCHRPLYSTTALSLTAVLVVIMPFGQTFASFAVIYVSFGLIYGIMTGLILVVTADMLGGERLNLSFGYIMLACGLGSLIGPPIVGWVYDVCGTFLQPYLVSGSLVLTSSLCMYTLIWRNSCLMKTTPTKNTKKDNTDILHSPGA